LLGSCELNFDGQVCKKREAKKAKGHKGGAGKLARKQKIKSAQKQIVSKLGTAINALQGQRTKLDAKEAALQKKVEAASTGSLLAGIWTKSPSN
jgi:hypothetical protein